MRSCAWRSKKKKKCVQRSLACGHGKRRADDGRLHGLGFRHALQDVCRVNLAAMSRVLAASPWIPVRLLEARKAAEALADDAPLSRMAIEAFQGWAEPLLAE